jgi:outer membrane protein assembly factor BamB
MTSLPLKRCFVAAVTIACGLLLQERAAAGPNKLNASGEADLTYTYVLNPGDAQLTAAELTSLQTTLQDASRHLCRATDGLVKVTHWLIDPAAKVSDADVVAYPRVAGRANSGIVMFNDFLDATTLGHELGHYLTWLPDQYQEQRRGGESFGIGGAFFEANPALSTPINGTNNTMMEDQFALAAAGLEFQLSHDAVYDLRHGDDNPNQAVDESYPVPSSATAINVTALNLGTSGTAQAINLTNVRTALDTSVAHASFELIDQGGEPRWGSTGEDTESAAYSWGDHCDFGRGSVRTWLFLEWTGGANYRLIVAAEDRQFTPGAGTMCADDALNTIALRQLAAFAATSGTPGCGDGVVGAGEECEPTLTPGARPCTSIPGAGTSSTATTTCNPATCTWRRSGCYAGSTASCGLLNVNPQQCYTGFLGELTLDACPAGGGTQTCTDCLDDPAGCPRAVGSLASVTNNNTVFNVPNTAFSVAQHSVGANFGVRLSVQSITTGGASSMAASVVGGAGECTIFAQAYGLCGAGGHTASCAHVCGESFSQYAAGTTPPGAFEMTDGNRAVHWGADPVNADLRCQNRDRAPAVAPMRPQCETDSAYPLVVSEWDLLQYNLRRRGLSSTLLHNGAALGMAGDDLTWGQQPPVSEGAQQSCNTYGITVDVRPSFSPSTPGSYDTALVLDTSGSMATPATKDNTKTRADLATAAGVAALQMLNSAQTAPASMSTYNVALTSFATTATASAAAVSMNAAGLASMTTSLQGRPTPAGNTAIGDGLRTGYSQLSPTAGRNRFLILVSDGFHNTGDRPEDVARQLIASDPQLRVCPVFFGEAPDQSSELLSVANEGKCALRIADPNSNDIAITMFEIAGERAGGSVLMSDRATVANDAPPVLLSSILSSLSSSTSATTELVVSPEMKSLRMLVSDSGRNAAAWVPPTVTLTAPNGSTRVLNAGSAKFNEAARGYLMFELPITAAAESGTWQLRVTPGASAGSAASISNLSIVADRSNAQCDVRIDRAAYVAGSNVDVTVTPAHTLPLNLATISASVAVFGPSQDGTIRRFSVPLRRNPLTRQFTGRFAAPSSNGVYNVQALCEAARPISGHAESARFPGPVKITSLPAFRVQGSRQFVVTAGTFLCRSANDCDSDGVLNTNEPPGDADGDGVPNSFESDADDDGKLDGVEVGRDADADGRSDVIDADMNNDGRPDFITTPCSFPSSGGGAARSGVSTCRGSTGASPAWTNSQIDTPGDGVTLDKTGTAYFNATTSIFFGQSVVAVNANGSVRWTAPMPFAASTPPEVVEAAGLVAVGDVDGEVLAFDSRGRLAWRSYTDFPVSGLVARGSRIYVSTLLGGLYALDAYTGRRVWQQDSFLVPWGVPSIAPNGATLYVAYGIGLVAIDTATGALRWSRVFPMTFLNSLTVGSNGDLYMGALDNALYRFSGSTGAQIWRYIIPAGVVIGQPVVDGTNIFFGSSNDRVYALRDGTTPSLSWSATLNGDVVGYPVRAADGTIFAGTAAGQIYGLNGTNGSVLWQKSLTGKVGSIIAIGNNRTLFTDDRGRLYSY